MDRSFLEFSKQLLERLSFDPELLNKEYNKCLSYLKNEEKGELVRWLKDQTFHGVIKVEGAEEYRGDF